MVIVAPVFSGTAFFSFEGLMMQIFTRKVGNFLDVEITLGGVTFDLGLLDDRGKLELAIELKSAVEDLIDGIDCPWEE